MNTRGLSAGDDRGQILLLTALSMVVLLAVSALALDASFMYDKRNRLHASADAAAKSGAIEVRRNASVTNGELQVFGEEQVTAHLFSPGTTTSVVINHPPATGPYAGNAGYVEAIVSEPTGTFFGGILGLSIMTPGARAVAGLSSGPDCIITLAPPASSPDSFFIGNSLITMPLCSVANGGDMNVDNPNGAINASATGVTGTCSGQHPCDGINNMTTGAPPPTDPLVGLYGPSGTIGPPTNPGGCISLGPANVIGGVMTIPGNACYSRIDVPTSAATVNFGPGIIYLTGAFTPENNVDVNGTGVMFYLAGTAPTGPCTAAATAGCIASGQQVIWHVSAPTSGNYEGIVFFQDPANHLNGEFDGNNSVFDFSGAMYFPGADVSFRNGMNATNDCMLFVGRSLTIENGNGAFSNHCAAYGGSPILTISLAE